MILVDSNVWIGLLSEDDSLHEQAGKALELLASEKETIILSDHVLSEVSTHLLFHERPETLEKFRKLVLGSRDIILRCLTPEEAREVSERVGKSPKRLSFTDEVLRLLSERHNYGLLTFDNDLAKAK